MALSRKAKARLTRLIAFMNGLPREANQHFNMRWWVLHNDSGNVEKNEHGLLNGISRKKLLSCGTSACAAGWAATIPSFKRAGFVMRVDDGRLQPAISPVDFFDVTSDQEHDLFGSHNDDRTPKQWAKRARGLLKVWSSRR